MLPVLTRPRGFMNETRVSTIAVVRLNVVNASDKLAAWLVPGPPDREFLPSAAIREAVSVGAFVLTRSAHDLGAVLTSASAAFGVSLED